LPLAHRRRASAATSRSVTLAANYARRHARPRYPSGFRARRGLHWGVVGLMYPSYDLCRDNLSPANKGIADEFL
jgi:hypothetical protein